MNRAEPRSNTRDSARAAAAGTHISKSSFFKEEEVKKVNEKTSARSAAALAATAVLVLSGCATQAPMLTPQARSHYDAIHQKIIQTGVAVLAESCFYRLEVGTSHVLPTLSQAHASKVQRALAQGLEGQGVTVRA
jgi:non-ribosomal peptide synthetase component E (peptide arylation enzyme)